MRCSSSSGRPTLGRASSSGTNPGSARTPSTSSTVPGRSWSSEKRTARDRTRGVRSGGEGPVDDGEEVVAVAVGLDGTEAREGEQRLVVARPGLGHGGEGGVVEHEVAGDPGGPGGGGPPRLERGDQLG